MYVCVSVPVCVCLNIYTYRDTLHRGTLAKHKNFKNCFHRPMENLS